MLLSKEASLVHRVLCDHCDGVIGKHEPILIIEGERGRWTSLVAESEPPHGETFHHACFQKLRDAGTVPWLKGV